MSLVGDKKRNSNSLLANTERTSLLLQHSLGRLLLISSLMGYSPGRQAHPMALKVVGVGATCFQ